MQHSAVDAAEEMHGNHPLVVEPNPLESTRMERGNHFAFFVESDGEELLIPFHRVRAARKNGEVIWKR